jgi:acyl-coenzyme A synthetase/AMP-(fatty) acid ligase
MVRVFHEHEINADLCLLASAWQGDETFALVPDRAGVPGEWIRSSLASLPGPLRTGHFAMLTSGSTGSPKLIIGNKNRTESLARTLHQAQHSEPVAQAVLTLPLTYTYSFVNQWVWTHVHGRTLVKTRGLSHPEELETALAAAKDAMLCLVGVQVPLLAKYLHGRVFPGVIRVHFAGGRFPQEKLGDVGRMFPNARVFNNYGCAEAMPRLTIRRAEDSDQASNIGRTLPGIEMKANSDDALVFRSEYGAVGVVEGEGGFREITRETWVLRATWGAPPRTDRGNFLGARARCSSDTARRSRSRIS